MASLITVTGTGHVSAPVDMIEMTFTLTRENIDYNALMETSAEALSSLKASLVSSGFKDSDIKTLNFNVSRNYKSERDENGTYREIFAGYICTHDIIVRFDFSSERLAQIINAVSESKAEPRFTINFTVKDEAAMKKELLTLAFNEAKANAETLAEAACMNLIELKSIDYTGNSPIFSSATGYSEDSMNRSVFKAAAINMQPEDITSELSVKLVWEIG